MLEMSGPSHQEFDDEFDRYLVDMKPHVLRLTHKSERQRCASWIKKLCEPTGSSLTARKNRNMYCKLLFHMLQKGVVEGPFEQRPQSGLLPTLPAYASIYFDEPGHTPAALSEGITRPVPDWVAGELSDHYSSASAHSHQLVDPPSATSTLRADRYSKAQYTKSQHRTRTESGLPSSKSTSDRDYLGHMVKSREEVRLRQRRSFSFSSDEDDENKPRRSRKTRSPARNTEDWGLHVPSTASSKNNTSGFGSLPLPASGRVQEEMVHQYEKELELRTKMVEAKYHEEKLQVQQKHDQAIQKILDRKNSEMEDIKSHYRSKNQEMEESIRKLERKVQSMVKESTQIRETKDQQITELKKMVEHSDQSTLNEFEKKLHENMADFEQEKFEMQKQQTKAIQDILDDTNTRLHKMELEYNTQVDNHAAVIRDLESRITQLSQDSENHLILQTQLSQEKAEIQRQSELLSAELENTNARFTALEKEYERAKDDYDMETRSMRNKTDATIEFMKQEHALSAAKSSENIRELEQHVQDLKQSLQDSHHQRQRELRDAESMERQEKVHLETLHTKQITSVKTELEQTRQENQRNLHKLQQTMREKDEQVQRLQDSKKLQSQSAEKALEEFKSQVERNSGRMFDDMKQQMKKVEEDLAQSKELRQKQSKEFTKQTEQERKHFHKQLTDQETAHNQKYTQLLHQHQSDHEAMQQEHEHVLAVTTQRLQTRLEDEHKQNMNQRDKDSQLIAELEQQVSELREANMESNSLRKQQLIELGLLREDEKQKVMWECEATVSKLKSEMEQQRLRQQRDHSAELEQMLEKTNKTLKDIERDYTDRLAASAENTKELQNTIETLKLDSSSRRSQLQQEMTDVISKLEDEKQLLKKQHNAYIKTLHEDLDKQRNQSRQLDRQLQQIDFQHQDQMTHLKQEFESRFKGMMPISVRQELEETIESLKTQVNALQQKSIILQEEIEMGRKFTSTVRSPSRN
ncbi:centrosomal protein of 112 kDa-like isoform X2 [Asterias rubens]|uniref:centrosomal protein of 112 kDa-like isoform X2 n=1 Tax=Asterias rubens TaxID=7604 RepID=UPI001455680A|nr:centrosomal protein of 112 kDa-like isoform X2 [Asterias rubens]